MLISMFRAVSVVAVVAASLVSASQMTDHTGEAGATADRQEAPLVGMDDPCSAIAADAVMRGVPLRGAHPAPTIATITIEVSVTDAAGAPVSGAVLFSNLGGQTQSDAEGRTRLTLDIAPGTLDLHLTAVWTNAGVNHVGSRRITLSEHWSAHCPAQTLSVDGGIITMQANSECEPHWVPGFGVPGLGLVLALSVFDDGSGTALYAAGDFSTAGGVSANRIAKWDGSSWSALGSGVSGVLFALTVFDDGLSGGPALYAGGSFTGAGGVSANRIAKWDGAAWSPLGSGLGSTVRALTVFDDGRGTALYAGGQFTTAGGVSANGIAKWRGCLGPDCNGNGIDDAIDIVSGLSQDCNDNGIPDECEDGTRFTSVTAPFGQGAPIVHTFTDLAPVTRPVEFRVVVRADLDAINKFVTLRVGGTAVASLFAVGGSPCTESPDVATFTMPAAQYNALLSGGSLLVELIPSAAVSIANCAESSARVWMRVLDDIDCNNNDIPDLCDIASGFSSDCNDNGIPDECELAAGTLFDCDKDGNPDICQILADPSLDLNGDGYLDACSYAAGDFNLDGVIDLADLLFLLSLWNVADPPIGDLNGDGVVNLGDLLFLLANWGPFP